MMRPGVRAASAGACLALATACVSDAGQGASMTVDTLPGGTVRVRNGTRSLAFTAWTVESVARVRAASDSEGFGRVVSVALTGDSLLWVLDQSLNAVFVFDLSGRLVHRLGRSGSGPGEFTRPYALSVDSSGNVWVADEGNRRYTVFSDRGELVRSIRRGFRWPLTPGWLRVTSGTSLYEFGQTGAGQAVVRVETGADGGMPIDTVLLPGFEPPVFQRPASAGAERLGVPIPFTAQQSAAVARDGTVWTGVGSEYHFVQLLPTGDTARIVEFAAEAAELSAEERSAALAEAEKARTSGYEADDARLPRHHPAFSALLTTEDGEIWVQRIARDRADGVNRAVYDVFSGEGHYLGTLPAPFSVFPPPHASRTLIAGVVRDSLGEESVEVWRVVRQRTAVRAEPPR